MASNIVVLTFEEEHIKSDLPGITFNEPTKAEDFLEVALTWQEQGILEIEDAVVARRGESPDVKIKQMKSQTGKYALGGSGVGLLAGLLLGGPIGGLIGGAAVGAIAGKMKDYGIDDKFIKDMSKGLAPNSSALFLMGQATDRDKLMEKLKPYQAFVASTTLSKEQEQELRRALT